MFRLLFCQFVLFAGFLFPGLILKSQTTIWSENFNNGCASNCLASTWNGWTISDNVGGTTGGAPNIWFVSCAEEGVAPPGCGSSCIGDASLHIGANPGSGGDMGATFNETGATNATFRLAVSPTISTTTFTNLTLSFDFIAFGSSACSDDRAQLRLSTDNGATWPVGFQYCLTSACCGACNGYSQGQWTLYTLALPAAFENNPNVRVAFHWRNNGNGSGTDPSVAIDDVRITSSIALPADLVRFHARQEDKYVTLKWVTANEGQISRYEVEKSSDLTDFKMYKAMPVRQPRAEAEASYTLRDEEPLSGERYYRLKLIDQNGQMHYSQVIRISENARPGLELAAIPPVVKGKAFTFILWSDESGTADVELFEVSGRKVLQVAEKKIIQGKNEIELDISTLSSQIYFLKISPHGIAGESTLTGKFFRGE